MSDTVTVDPLEAGREAYARRAWPEAYRLLQEADGAGCSTAGISKRSRSQRGGSGTRTESIAAFERAYALHLERGNRSMAAMMALTLRREYGAKMAGSVAKAWLHRAEHLLEGEPEAVAHGYLEIAHAGARLRPREPRGSARAPGPREGDRLAAGRRRPARLGRDQPRRRCWATSGRLEEAFGLMEGAAAVAVGGELGPFTTGAVFCAVMSVCRETADYRRGSEWADVSKRWCERQDISGFPGDLPRPSGRVHAAHRCVGRRRLGGGDGIGRAAALPSRDGGRGVPRARRDPAPHGRPRGCGGGLRAGPSARDRNRNRGRRSCSWREVARTPRRPRSRAASKRSRGTSSRGPGCSRRRRRSRRCWAISAPRKPPRRSSRRSPEEFGTAAIRAAAAHAAGLAALLRETPPRRSERFRDARRLWREIDAPYEAAISTVLLAEARSARRGDRGGDARARGGPGRRSSGSARRPRWPGRTPSWPDLRSRRRRGRSARSCSPTSWGRPRWWRRSGTRPGTTSCAGTTKRCAAASQASAGEEVHRTGDGFFVAFADARSALGCAAAIQRALAEHRRDHGFAPQVRIGIHAAEATRVGGRLRRRRGSRGGEDRSARRRRRGAWPASRPSTGMDVVSSESLAKSTLKGLAKPVQVVASTGAIDWRSG